MKTLKGSVCVSYYCLFTAKTYVRICDCVSASIFALAAIIGTILRNFSSENALGSFKAWHFVQLASYNALPWSEAGVAAAVVGAVVSVVLVDEQPIITTTLHSVQLD